MHPSTKKDGPGLPWGDVELVNERLDSTQDQTSSNEGGNIDRECLSWSDQVSTDRSHVLVLWCHSRSRHRAEGLCPGGDGVGGCEGFGRLE